MLSLGSALIKLDSLIIQIQLLTRHRYIQWKYREHMDGKLVFLGVQMIWKNTNDLSCS